ncbi:hypothetical protein DITRI_Ditri01bG0129900 [Diplodiscus trichospermus]
MSSIPFLKQGIYTRKCPHHGLSKWLEIHTFYNKLGTQHRSSIDATAWGSIISKNDDEAYELIEKMAANDYQWPFERVNPKKVTSAKDVETQKTLATLVAQMANLTKIVEGRNKPKQVHALSSPFTSCEGS